MYNWLTFITNEKSQQYNRNIYLVNESKHIKNIINFLVTSHASQRQATASQNPWHTLELFKMTSQHIRTTYHGGNEFEEMQL